MTGLFDRPYVQGGPLVGGFCFGVLSLFILWVGFRDLIGPFAGGAVTSTPTDPLRARLNRLARDTHYALTDHRIILWEPAPFGNVRVRSFRAKDLSGISRTQRPDGSGDLHLEILAPLASGQAGLIPLGSLRRIDNVRAVEALIRSNLFPD